MTASFLFSIPYYHISLQSWSVHGSVWLSHHLFLHSILNAILIPSRLETTLTFIISYISSLMTTLIYLTAYLTSPLHAKWLLKWKGTKLEFVLPTPAFNTEKTLFLAAILMFSTGATTSPVTQINGVGDTQISFCSSFYTHSLESAISPSPEPIPNPTSSYHLHATSLVVATYLSWSLLQH